MATFMRGDWVVYDPGYKKPEIGRVWAVPLDESDAVFVCFHHGCTPAATPRRYLKPYNRDEYPNLVPDARIGYHRFDGFCPEYVPEVCGHCKPERYNVSIR